jgi:hypothetical protein
MAGTYLAHIGDITLDYDLDCCSLTCCCGGQGCIRQVFARPSRNQSFRAH